MGEVVRRRKGWESEKVLIAVLGTRTGKRALPRA
jgi:hypothetical protein